MSARVQPASRSARSVLTDVGVALRQSEHVRLSVNETLTELAGHGTLLVTELPGELVLNFTGSEPTDLSTLRRLVSERIRHAAGSRSAAAKLVITWAESTPELTTRSA